MSEQPKDTTKPEETPSTTLSVPTVIMSKRKLSRKEAIEQLWLMGNLDYLLKGKQKDVKSFLRTSPNDIVVVLCSRRFGKSFTLCTLAVETCIKKPNAVVKYACPQKDMVQKVINPAIETIIADCPISMKPEWKEQRKLWLFPNGSQIQVAGTDKGTVESLRGASSDLSICDEAGFMDDLDYIIKSVLAPMSDTTGGKIVLVSTPNYKDPNHDFHTTFVYPLQDSENLIKFTLYDSPMVDDAKREQILSRYPGRETNSQFRCEYLCEINQTRESAVIPEFNASLMAETVVEWKRPAYVDFYTAADTGFRDLTGILFSYWDFKNSCLVIEDELVMNGEEMTTASLAEKIRLKEHEVYKNQFTNTPTEPFIRVMDNNNLILVNDLFKLHNMTFFPTKKDNKDAQINNLRIMFAEKRIIINPRCKNLIYHLKNTKWNKHRNDFDRIKDSPDGTLRGGHGDLVDALIYLTRNVLQTKNPYPAGYGLMSGENVFSGFRDGVNEMTDMMKGLFGRKPH